MLKLKRMKILLKKPNIGKIWSRHWKKSKDKAIRLFGIQNVPYGEVSLIYNLSNQP